MIEIGDKLAIADKELHIEAGVSRGPGGQNVNRVHSRVTIAFDVAASRSLSEEQRAKILERLASRITKAGVLKVRSERHRTQQMNRAAARRRLVELLEEALEETGVRRPTQPSVASKLRRRESKRRRSRLKESRRAGLDQSEA